MRSHALLLIGSLATFALGQDPTPADTFAPPVRIKAGDKFLGEGRLYPSPVFFDVNGDGLLDIVVGDLPGRITIALQKPGKPGEPIAYAAETKMNGADGKPIDFGNW